MSALHHLLYVSHARIDACGPDIRRILDVARQRNAEMGITGLLLYTGDHFAQRLEGPADALDILMRSIRLDERHNILHEWRACPIDRRRHGHWALGYVYDDRVENWLRSVGRSPAPALDEAAAQLFQQPDFS